VVTAAALHENVYVCSNYNYNNNITNGSTSNNSNPCSHSWQGADGQRVLVRLMDVLERCDV